MSNILSPIVARYSLFFSLATFDSSWVSHAKNPAQAVQEALLQAQQRYQDSAARKLKALIRNASIASSASLSSNKSKHSLSSVLTSGSLSTAPTSTCSASPSSHVSNVVISLTPCDNTSPIQVEHACLSSLPSTHESDRKQCSDHSDHPYTQLSSSSSSTTHNAIVSIATVACSSSQSTPLSSSPSPAPPPSISPVSISLQNHSHVPDCNSAQQGQGRTLIQCKASSSVPSPPSSSMTKHRQKRSSSRRNPKASIAILLSVALAMILLSLLHSRRQRLRKRRQSIKRHSRSHSCRSHSRSPSHHRQGILTGEVTQAVMTLHYSRPLSLQPHSARRRSHDYLGILPTTASIPNTIQARPSRTRSHRQSKIELVTAWLDQQDTRPSEEEDHALNDPWLAMSQEEETFSIIDNQPLGSDQYSDYIQYTESHRSGHGSHKRSISLAHPNHVSQEEQELQWYRERYQSHPQRGDLSYKRRFSAQLSHTYHHQRTIELVEFHHSYDPIGQAHGWEPLGLASQKRRSANELAWERHMFYQEQQYQEEAKAERRRIEERQQQEQYWQYQQEHYEFQRQMEHRQEEQKNVHHRHLSLQLESDTVARTGSLNRLRSAALSTDTARALGLCRSTTLSAGGRKACKTKNKRAASPKRESVRITHTLLSVEDNKNNSASTRHRVVSHDGIGIELPSNHYDTISSASSYFAPRVKSHSGCSTPACDVRPCTPVQLRDSPRPSVSAPSTLSRKKTLKDLAPALRSLARACSTRFSRPNSMDGSSVNVAQGERSGRSSTQSDHMNDFRPLSMGPDSLAEFQQQQRNSLALSSAMTAGAPVPAVGTTVVFLPITFSSKSSGTTTTARTKERPAVYRKVSPFRSNTNPSSPRPKLVSSASLPQNLAASDESIRPRNSLRFANGRGLDYHFFDTDNTGEDRSEGVIVAMGTTLDDSTDESNTQDELDSVPEEVIHAIGDGDDDQNRVSPTNAQEALRREISALLAKGVRPLSAAATATVTQEAPPPPSVPAPCLSPLAVEAQEELSLPPSPNTTPVQGNDMYFLSEADLRDQIAFMLVPRYKYRYQPLIAQ